MGKKTRKDFDTDLEYETYRKKINAAEVKRRGKIRPQINAAEEKRNRELKQEVMNEYSIGKPHCLHCGETRIEFLTIDHINGRKVWNHEKGFNGRELYRWLRKNNFPRGFQVLCWNWNQIKGVKEAEMGSSMTKSAIQHRIFNQKLKKQVMTEYSRTNTPRCVCCGYEELDALTVDHVDGRKNIIGQKRKFMNKKLGKVVEQKIWGDKMYRWLRDKKFPKGYQTLCQNCNSAKSDNGICPHQT